MRLLSSVLKCVDIIVENYGYSFERVQKTARDEPLEILSNAVAEKEKIVNAAQADARKIIENANNLARIIVENASGKAKKEVDRARKTGHEEGFNKGREEADKIIFSKLQQFESLMGEIEKEKSSILDEFEDSLKDLALLAAKKIINTELETDDEAFITLFESAVSEFNEQEWIKVVVSDCEADFVTSNAKRLMSMVRGAKDIKISSIEGAPRGTCVVETSLSIVDTGVATQLDRLKIAFDNVAKAQ